MGGQMTRQFGASNNTSVVSIASVRFREADQIARRSVPGRRRSRDVNPAGMRSTPARESALNATQGQGDRNPHPSVWLGSTRASPRLPPDRAALANCARRVRKCGVAVPICTGATRVGAGDCPGHAADVPSLPAHFRTGTTHSRYPAALLWNDPAHVGEHPTEFWNDTASLWHDPAQV
jgi:hypothetical protein